MKQKLKHLEELFDLLNKTRGQDTLGLSAEGLRRLLERLLSGIAAEGEQRHALVKYLMAIFEPAEGGELTLERLQNIYRWRTFLFLDLSRCRYATLSRAGLLCCMQRCL